MQNQAMINPSKREHALLRTDVRSLAHPLPRESAHPLSHTHTHQPMQSLTHPLTGSPPHQRMRLAAHLPSGWMKHQLTKPRPDHSRQLMIEQSHNRAPGEFGENSVTP